MNIAVIGTGYVGLVTGTCFAEIGHNVICVDKDKSKIDNLKKGSLPIYEPGLEELVARNTKNSRLSFTADIKKAIEKSEIIFLAVGTPPEKDYKADLSAVRSVAASIGHYANSNKIVVTKSTVPVGTGDLIADIIKKNSKKPFQFSIVSNPEFLREGNAIQDFLEPDRIVVGTDDKKTGAIMKELYLPIIDDEHPFILTDLRSAEVIKYAANAFLATKISFINEIANFCQKANADISEVAKGIGLDKRIGRKFLNAGIGYGGSCFPKDVRALIQTGKEHGHSFHLLDAVEKVNDLQKEILLEKLFKIYPEITGKTISIWGLSFKPNTDDIREAPSIVLIRKLLENGAKIRAFDPISNESVKQKFPGENIHFASNPYEATEGSSALLILTEWDEFRSPDFAKIKKLMKEPHILDGRNLHHPSIASKHQINYYSIGRKDIIIS
ncbi:MAG: UDP-glucose/GDP-mannose dehydrogenase family protein [bacterium]|nr:UDP-glucose/GDP-mannose dehydrogenase family protein [bacterium]